MPLITLPTHDKIQKNVSKHDSMRAVLLVKWKIWTFISLLDCKTVCQQFYVWLILPLFPVLWICSTVTLCAQLADTVSGARTVQDGVGVSTRRNRVMWW